MVILMESLFFIFFLPALSLRAKEEEEAEAEEVEVVVIVVVVVDNFFSFVTFRESRRDIDF